MVKVGYGQVVSQSPKEMTASGNSGFNLWLLEKELPGYPWYQVLIALLNWYSLAGLLLTVTSILMQLCDRWICNSCHLIAETGATVRVTINNIMNVEGNSSKTPSDVERQAIAFHSNQLPTSTPAAFSIADMSEHVELRPVKPACVATVYDQFGNLRPAYMVE